MVKFFCSADQTKTALLNQILKTQTSIHIFFSDRNDKTQVRLNHFFFRPSAQHQSPTESNDGHLDQSGPFFGVGKLAVITFKLCREFFEVEKVCNFPSQLDLFIGTQETNAANLLEIDTDGIFGVNPFWSNFDAGKHFGFGFSLGIFCFRDSCVCGFGLGRSRFSCSQKLIS